MRILWGGATSASQYEGDGEHRGLDSQDCRPYRPRVSNATEETRLLTEAQVAQAINGDNQFYPFRKGTEGVAHLEEDLDYLAELGLEVYRFSISWSRLYPTGKELEPNPEGVAYYDQVFDGVKRRGIKVFLALNHYAIPIGLIQSYGGWKGKECIGHYVRMVEFVMKRWGNYVDYWLPINEINTGYFSPYNGLGLVRKDVATPYDLSDVFQALHHQFVASARVIQLGRSLGVPGQFGAMIACFCYYPLTSHPEDNLKWVQEEQMNQWYCMDILSKGEYPYYASKFFRERGVRLNITEEERQLLKDNTCDFVSISFYTSSVITTQEAPKTAGNLVVSTRNPYLEATEWGWQIDPVGLRTSLHRVYERYQKPIIISENGLGSRDVLADDGTVDDQYRIDYLRDYFEQAQLACEDGIPLLAYFVWGIIDIVSAGSCEMDKRYGVVYVDADNDGNGSYQRYRKKSFYWYQDFIRHYKEQQLKE